MKRSMAALVMGNAAYPDGEDLPNPVNDARDFGAKLESYGFKVIVATDCTAAEMSKHLKAFRKLLDTHETGLFFFAGHGVQIEGRNYLLALDTDMETEDDAQHSSLPLDKVVSAMEKSTASTKIIILDACRKNPWERAWHRGPGTRGLASVYAPKGTIIGFATSPGEVAYDGEGDNGTYTGALLQHIDTPDCSIETMFKRVRNTVAAESGGKQTSWEHTSLSGEFYFNLSLGNRIQEYDVTALADELFVLDPTKKSHLVIEGLKTRNWYKQNPVIESLDAGSANRMSVTSLFVIGRNIYQAACGASSSAQYLIKNFLDQTRGFLPPKRKAILDGVLFEIFFDPRGELRPAIKAQFFNEAFDLQRFADLKDSFDFIAEALVAANGDFHAVPGKGHELAVTISTKPGKKGATVQAIYIGGENALRAEEDSWDTIEGDLSYAPIDPARLKKRLSEQLAVPLRFLNVTFSPKSAAEALNVQIPRGWTVRKAAA